MRLLIYSYSSVFYRKSPLLRGSHANEDKEKQQGRPKPKHTQEHIKTTKAKAKATKNKNKTKHRAATGHHHTRKGAHDGDVRSASAAALNIEYCQMRTVPSLLAEKTESLSQRS